MRSVPERETDSLLPCGDDLRKLGMSPAGAALKQTVPPAPAPAHAHAVAHPPAHPTHPHVPPRPAPPACRAEEIVPLAVRDGLEITKLFPAENKPDYKEQLRGSCMVGRRSSRARRACAAQRAPPSLPVGRARRLRCTPCLLCRGLAGARKHAHTLLQPCAPPCPFLHPLLVRSPHPCLALPPPLPPQFGAGYVLSRLQVLSAAGGKAAREERCRMLALLGHLLKLQARFGLLKAGPGGLEELADKAKMAVSWGLWAHRQRLSRSRRPLGRIGGASPCPQLLHGSGPAGARDGHPLAASCVAAQRALPGTVEARLALPAHARALPCAMEAGHSLPAHAHGASTSPPACCSHPPACVQPSVLEGLLDVFYTEEAGGFEGRSTYLLR